MATTVTANTFALLKSKKPREITHPVVVDEEAVEAYAEARRDLTEAQEAGDQAAIDAAQAACDAAEPAAEAAIVQLKIRALPRMQFAALKAAHPAQDEDHKRMERMAGVGVKAAWHSKTFQPELVAACVIEPKLTVEQVEELAESWNDAEWNLLTGACLRVNQEAADPGSLVFKSGQTPR